MITALIGTEQTHTTDAALQANSIDAPQNEALGSVMQSQVHHPQLPPLLVQRLSQRCVQRLRTRHPRTFSSVPCRAQKITTASIKSRRLPIWNILACAVTHIYLGSEQGSEQDSE